MTQKLLLLLIILSSFFTVSAQEDETQLSESANEIGEYNNYIVHQQSMMMRRLVEYIVHSVHNENFKEVEDKRQGVLFQIDLAIHNLEKLKPLESGDEMREKALEVFKLYKKLYSEDYGKINLLKRTKENSFENMETYFDALDKAESEINNSFNELNKVQLDFAEKHELKIKEHEKDGTMEIIANLNKYSRAVFLEYFKVYKLSSAFMNETVEQNDETAETTGEALLKGTEDAYTNLKNIEAYKGDEDYKNKAMAYVAYNKLFSTKDFPSIMSILTKEERSQADIDSLNEILTQYYNDTNDLLNQFNNANLNLMRTHIPNTTARGNKG